MIPTLAASAAAAASGGSPSRTLMGLGRRPIVMLFLGIVLGILLVSLNISLSGLKPKLKVLDVSRSEASETIPEEGSSIPAPQAQSSPASSADSEEVAAALRKRIGELEEDLESALVGNEEPDLNEEAVPTWSGARPDEAALGGQEKPELEDIYPKPAFTKHVIPEERRVNVTLLPPILPVVYDPTNPSPREWNPARKVHLITSFFRGNYSAERTKELLLTLKMNLENPDMEAVHIFWEDVNPRGLLAPLVKNPGVLHKLATMKIKSQPSYRTLFSYANTQLERGAIAIVSNADIYFDDSIRALKFGRPANADPTYRSALALSRRHAPECGKQKDWRDNFDICAHYIGSHDSFVFAPPLPEFIINNTEHVQNRYGSENIVVWAFLWTPGFIGHVSNPCQRIRGFHYHCVQERHYERGKFISKWRHGKIAPGVLSTKEKEWNYIF